MKTKTLSFNLRLIVIVVATMSLLLSTMFVPVHKAEAQSASDLEALIEKLEQRLEELRNQLNNQPIVVGTDNTNFCQYRWTKNLLPGSKGSDVQKLQRFLSKTGDYKAEVSGYFGNKTEKAVQRFQTREGIVSKGSVTTTGFGMVGKLTRLALNKRNICNNVDEFGFKDIKSITSEYVDPIPEAADDEYYKYVVTLDNGKKHEVHFYPQSVAGTQEDLFRDIGYTGSMANLLRLIAEEAPKFFCDYKWTENLKKGDRGNGVSQLQRFLSKIGDYNAEVTGYFGPVTERALQRYQAREGIVSEGTAASTGFGVFGKLTRKAVNKAHGCADDSDDSSSYGLSDVKSVIYKNVDPIPGGVDDEYTKYTVRLKDGTKHVVECNHFAPQTWCDDAFKKTGYTGDISKLKDMAIEDEEVALDDDELSCKLYTDKKTYTLGDDIKLSWGSENAVSAKFLIPADLKVGITLPTGILSPADDALLNANVLGNHTVTLEVVDGNGGTETCEKSFKVVEEGSAAEAMVDLKVKGKDALNEIKAERYVDISWQTENVKDCQLVKEYKGKTVTSDANENNSGRKVLLVRQKDVYGLDSLMLKCKHVDTGETIKDKIQIDFYSATRKYVATVNGDEVENTKTYREKALGKCLALVNEYKDTKKVVLCTFSDNYLFGSNEKTDDEEDSSGNVLGASTSNLAAQVQVIINKLQGVTQSIQNSI